MKLVVTTPTELIAVVEDLHSVRAEDETGAFGIEPGHADFVTVLPVSIITWKDANREGFVAVRGGVLTVREGTLIEVAARGAWREEDLARLGPTALADLQRADEDEDITRTYEHRLQLATVRQIEQLLRGARESQMSAPQLEPRSGPRA